MNAETRKYAKMVATYELFASGFPRLSAHLPRPPFPLPFPPFLPPLRPPHAPVCGYQLSKLRCLVIPLLPCLRSPLVGTPSCVPFPIAMDGSKAGSRSCDLWLPRARRIERYGFRFPNSNSLCKRWWSRYVMDNRSPRGKI